MATILLSAAGTAIGGSIGGSVLGLSTAAAGRAVGAAFGRAIDERLLGAGAEPVDVGRIDRFRLTGASEGAAVGRVWGRMRVSGQVIWASPFVEHTSTTGGGKGAPAGPKVTEYSYSISLAVAVCEGEITHVGRVWADGQEVSRDALNLRVYTGSRTQQPDPTMEAHEGAGQVPAYRGIAYVVLEDFDLSAYGNRVPQLSFEVFRPATVADPARAEDLAHLIRGVALIPGTGEYAIATTPVYFEHAFGEISPANVNTPSGKADLVTSLDAMTGEMPNCASVSLVVSWFGSDLRAGHCTARPKVEQADADPEAMPWTVSGLDRQAAELVARSDGRPVYGGTPTDRSVIEAIREMSGRGLKVMFYPFLLMDQLAGNTLPDPWTGQPAQPVLPWRGRITTDRAPGVPDSTDGTAAAEAEVAAFFGAARASDFQPTSGGIAYTGPADWGLRRMILHYAHLCAQSGGVDAFCIGSEFVALTQIRGANGRFPAVDALRALAADVRTILGPGVRIGYAADWSEYHGYTPPGTADKLFHLDPLWSDPAIDFIGIDNYLPLSDWRDGDAHADAAAGAITNLDYLTGNVAGGELFDWHYATDADRDAQIRTPITDGDGEPWVWRAKDLVGWWSNPHHERIDGLRSPQSTSWVPGSKPIWFTELGCAAIDKGTNQPNKFLDPKSSESRLPAYSTGLRDDLIQIQYCRAIHRHFADPAMNPVSALYGGPMVDMSRAHAWAWDARPWPAFPARGDLWSDGGNYHRGHWLNGRTAGRPLASVVREICGASGVSDLDTAALHGVVRGYRAEDVGHARSTLQPLQVAYGFDAAERDGRLVFRSRTGGPTVRIDPDRMVAGDDGGPALSSTRAAEAETTGRVRVGHLTDDGGYEAAWVEARFPDDAATTVTENELALSLTRPEGRRIAERWLAEARLARDGIRFALPPSASALEAGDIVQIGADPGRWRIDRIETTERLDIEAVRVEPEIYAPHETGDEVGRSPAPPASVPVAALFLDLPILTGREDPYAPHVAFTARPWPGRVALYAAVDDTDYALDHLALTPATVGTTLTPLARAPAGLFDRGPALRVRLVRGTLSSVSEARLLAGRNALAIGTGDDDTWEVLQFARADLVAPRTYDLSMRLRGQAGTDGVMPGVWPPGMRVVLLDGTPKPIGLSPAERDAERHYRWGPADRPLGDPTYRHATRAFPGVGLRPYSPCHLRARDLGGDLAVSWVRRTRLDGDSWSAPDVPLGEEREQYRLRVAVAGRTVRDELLDAPAWTYSAADLTQDGADLQGCRIEVAQISAVYGPGPAARIDLAPR